MSIYTFGKHHIKTDECEPIFIVGAPRSGTTLFAAMLNNHNEIACGVETHFFNKIGPEKLYRAIEDPKWPGEAVNHILSLTLAGQKVYKLFETTFDEIHDFLLSKDPSIRAMLESLTLTYARKRGKNRWAEKTPNHLLFLDLIRKEIFNAKIIRIVRDFRDSAISMRKLPWASDSIIANSFLMDKWYHNSFDFFLKDQASITIRYEDLVHETKEVLMKVCDFIGIDYKQEMLFTGDSGGDVQSANEVWKSDVTKPVNLSRVFIWKNELPKPLKDLSTQICLDWLKTFGYDTTSDEYEKICAYPINRDVIEKYEDVFIKAASSKHIFIKGSCPIDCEKLLLLPDQRIGTSNFRVIFKIFYIIFLRFLKRRKTYYLGTIRFQNEEYGHKILSIFQKAFCKAYPL